MSEREWRFYLSDMPRFAEKVQTYSAGLDQAAFEQDELRYDAILRNLELIGEAASHVPPDVRDTYTSIPCRQISATRNHLIHGHLGIDNDTLWSYAAIERLVPTSRPDDEAARQHWAPNSLNLVIAQGIETRPHPSPWPPP